MYQGIEDTDVEVKRGEEEEEREEAEDAASKTYHDHACIAPTSGFIAAV